MPSMANRPYQSRKLRQVVQGGAKLKGKRQDLTLFLYKNISKFIHSSDWENGVTKKDKKYLNCKYKHHSIRIYGEEKKSLLRDIYRKKLRLK